MVTKAIKNNKICKKFLEQVHRMRGFLLVFLRYVGYNFKKERKRVGYVKKAAPWLLMTMVLLAGCGSSQAGSDQRFVQGETVSTAWFDYTVTGVQSMGEYGGYISAEGDQLVVVELDIKSTYAQPITMFDSDFQLTWSGMEEDDTRCMPVEYYCDQQLPAEYELASRESRSGVLVYQVPQEETDFQFLFREVFDDGTQEGRLGDLYIMDLTPQT